MNNCASGSDFYFFTFFFLSEKFVRISLVCFFFFDEKGRVSEFLQVCELFLGVWSPDWVKKRKFFSKLFED